MAGGAEVVHLRVSFRAVPALQEMVNAAFAPCMTAETPAQPAYVALAPCRDGVESQPAVVVVPVPKPYGDYRKVVDWKIDESLPDALGAIASNANLALEAQAGVNLDEEAVNLQRYQQAFQASGKVMQVAATLFDSLLQIR